MPVTTYRSCSHPVIDDDQFDFIETEEIVPAEIADSLLLALQRLCNDPQYENGKVVLRVSLAAFSKAEDAINLAVRGDH